MDNQESNVRDFLQANGNVVLKRVDNNYSLRSFTQKEIEYMTYGYYTVLGEGGFGKVYKGLLDYLRPVAVKRYKNKTKKEEFAKEVIVHSQINHKNVVRLLGCCTEENALMIVMEFVCNGNLHNILHCKNANGLVPFPLDKRLDIAIESAEALSCMHSMYSPVLHGDIKPANILLDENFRPKISDFGIARLLAAEETQHTRSVIGCIGYMDPLYCQSGILTPKSDVYSFGVVLLEIITRKKAVDGDIILSQSFAEALGNGKKVRQMFDEEIANDRKNMKLLHDIAKLAAECLKMEAKMRPGMVEVANKLRTVRKAFHQRNGRNFTGSNFGLITSGNAKDAISPTPVTAATVNNNDETLPSVVPTISMDELKQITFNFSHYGLIGEGSSSKVFFGVLKDGHRSGIKKLNPTKDITLEVPVVSRFKHGNVIQLLGYCVEGDNRFLAYEPKGEHWDEENVHRDDDEYASGGDNEDNVHSPLLSRQTTNTDVKDHGHHGSTLGMRRRSMLGEGGEAVNSTGIGGGWQLAWKWSERQGDDGKKEGGFKRIYLHQEGVSDSRRGSVVSLPGGGDAPEGSGFIHAAALVSHSALYSKDHLEERMAAGPAMMHPSEAAAKGPSWKDLFEPGVRRALVVGIGIQMLQQFAGINGVLYYTPQILEQAGVSVLLSSLGLSSASASILISSLTTLLMLPSIGLAMRLMDISGRRFLLLGTIPVLIASLVVLVVSNVISLSTVPHAVLSTVSVIVYFCCFVMGFGPIPNILCAEIFPTRVRGLCIAICALTFWICDIIVTYSLPVMLNAIGLAGVFGIYAVVCCISFVFVYLKVPETKGMPLEVITEFFAVGAKQAQANIS